MKKKILITAKDLKIGGIEKALVNLVNYLTEENDVTLVLEKKEGEFIKDLDSKIKIEEYIPSTNKFIIFRKFINLTNRLKAIMKYKNKFDTSISFATYSIPGSFIARIGAKNSILWVHTDYWILHDKDEKKIKEFFKNIKYKEFTQLVFVSKSGMKNFLKIFPQMEKQVTQCNNLINYDDIVKQALKKIELDKENIFTFLNVSRHDEKSKKISRIIKAAKLLKKDNLNFKILLVGQGEDTENYKKMAKDLNLNENIIFLGKKENPYPYFKISDCVILSSDYEGYPVVFLESFILNKPIITTNVSDYEEVASERGIVVNKNIKEIYEAMKSMIEEGYDIKNTFNPEKYNNDVKNKIKGILD